MKGVSKTPSPGLEGLTVIKTWIVPIFIYLFNKQVLNVYYIPDNFNQNHNENIIFVCACVKVGGNFKDAKINSKINLEE